MSNEPIFPYNPSYWVKLVLVRKHTGTRLEHHLEIPSATIPPNGEILSNFLFDYVNRNYPGFILKRYECNE